VTRSRALLLGEFPRTLDDRFRLSIPAELAEPLLGDEEKTDCILAKERIGCLSLWSPAIWRERLDSGVKLIESKMLSGRLDGRTEHVQWLGRMLSTRHRDVSLAGRGRLVVPEGFREFLAVEPGGEVMVVGAGVCVEIWQPAAWFKWLEGNMPEFRKLFDELTQ
jgi:MraZ protein